MSLRSGIGFLLVVGWASSAQSLPFVGPSCLEKLAGHAQRWAECTQVYSRNDRHCKPYGGALDAAMRECRAKGKTDLEINRAVNRGFASAGRPIRKAAPQPVPPPSPPVQDDADKASQVVDPKTGSELEQKVEKGLRPRTAD